MVPRIVRSPEPGQSSPIFFFSDVLRHQLGQDFVLRLDLLLQVGDSLLLGGVVRPCFLLEGRRPVLEELFLPAVVGCKPSSSPGFEMGSLSSKCRLRMATFSSGV